MGIGDTNGGNKVAGVLYPVAACHFSVAVEGMLACPEVGRGWVVATGEDGGDAGLDFGLVLWSTGLV